MKLFAIDIGNTKIKVCSFITKINDKEKWDICLPKDVDFDTFDDFEKNIIDNIDIRQEIATEEVPVAVSSVVPELTDIMIKKIKNATISQFEAFIVTHKNCDIKLNVENPETVGTDRLCNIASAIEYYDAPSIIVDFGTANTYDVIDSNCAFIGGAIAPGIETSAQYLIEKAALLEKTELHFPNQAIGKNTKTNIQSGIMFGAIDQIAGMINRIKEETKVDNYSIILTGGFGKLLSPELGIDHIMDEHLTLKGILNIYKNNYTL